MRFSTIFASVVAILGMTSIAAPAVCTPSMDKRDDSLSPRADLNLDSTLAPRAESPTLKDAINAIHHPESDYFHRDQWLKRIVDGLRDKWGDHNVFAFHRFGGDFKWGVTDPKSMEAEAAYFDWGERTEYFQVVVFKSAGILERVGGDGGWANWGYSGWYDEDGDKVTFREPPKRASSDSS